MKKLLFIVLAMVLGLTVGLVGCGGGGGGVGQFTLTVRSGNGGEITAPGLGDTVYTFNNNTVVAIDATPYTGYSFTSWTGSAVANSTDPTTTITMDGNKDVTANFAYTGPNWTWAIPLKIHYTMNSFASLWLKSWKNWTTTLNSSVGAYGGTFSINLTFGASPWDAPQSLTSVAAGISDIGQISSETFHLGTISVLPFMFPNMTSAAYAAYQIWETEEETWRGTPNQLKDIKVLLATPLYPNQLRSKVNITQPDLQLLNIRCEDPEVPMIEALNGTPKLGIAYLGVGNAMMNNIVDAAFLSYDGMYKSGACNYSNFTTIVDLFPRPYILGMNIHVYKALPPEARTIIDNISGLSKSVLYAQLHESGIPGAIATLNASDVAQGFGPWYYLSPSEKAAWKVVTDGIYPGWMAEMASYGINGTLLKAHLEALVPLSP